MPSMNNSPSLNIPGVAELTPGYVDPNLELLNKIIKFEDFRPALVKLCHYGKMGRPHYDEVLMFKILILQSLYNLSDVMMEAALKDRRSFAHFLSMSDVDKVPDSNTIRGFRERLGEKGVRELFNRFKKQMKKKGLRCSKGIMVDATFQLVPIQRNTPEENKHIKEKQSAPEGWSAKKRAHKDVEAGFTKKGGVTYYGYKGHVAADEKTKIILNYKTTTASTHDSQVCAELLPEEGDNKSVEVLADSGYMGEKNRKELKAKGAKPRIMQRRVRGQKELTERQKRRNTAIARRRCRIEHIFGMIKQFGGDIFRGVGLSRCCIRQGLVFLAYNMKRLCFLERTGQLCPETEK